MDNILEILVPIIFALVYLFAGVGKKKKDKAESPQETSELSEQERDIQEEIRRKIMERARGRPAPSDAPAAESSAPRPYDPTVPERRSTSKSPVKRFEEPRRPGRRRYEEPTSEPEPVAIEISPMQREIEERQRQIRQVQERAEQLKAQADARMKKVKVQAKVPRNAYSLRVDVFGDTFRERFIRGLREKESLKRAILSYEVLGTPVGQRREGKSGPFWER